MPNHIHNILTFEGEQKEIDRLLTFIQYEDTDDEEATGRGTIDFNKIIPRAKELTEMEESSNKSDGMALVIHFSNPRNKQVNERVKKMSASDFKYYVALYKSEKIFYNVKTTLTPAEIKRMTKYRSLDELISLGLKALENLKKYGATSWYHWSCDNWGTKWNSYDNWSDGNLITFSTAWSAPHPVIEKLAEMFPSIRITHKWADEDIGSNCGEFHYVNGMCVDGFTDRQMSEEDAVKYAKEVWGYDDSDFEDEPEDSED